jgi:type II restriction enzyme
VRAQAASKADHTHTEIQGWLRDLGLALGFDVWIASNDAGRPYGPGRLSGGCLNRLPERLTASGSAETVQLIDVLWLGKAGGDVAAAFEVARTTSIYSGIVRMLDLALGVEGGTARNFFRVARDNRGDDVRAQFAGPAFSRVGDLDPRYLPSSELRGTREAIARPVRIAR